MAPSGVESLPVELLNEIFSWMLVGYWRDDWNRQWRAKCRIMAVCSLWRAVLYTMTPYWSAISIHRRSSDAYIEFAVQRALRGDITIWLEYSAQPPVSPSMAEFIVMLEEHLMPVFYRVTRLHVGGGTADDWPPLAQALSKYNGAGVKSAFLTFTGAGTMDDLGFAVLRGMPNISELVCHSMPPSVGLGTWAGLTYLDICQRDSDDALPWLGLRDALSAARSLEKLKLDDVVCEGMDGAGGSVVLPRLISIILLCRHEESLQIAAHIEAPSLRDVKCDIHSREAVQGMPLLALTCCAGAARWDVGIADMSGDDVWAVLGGMPGVVELDLMRSQLQHLEALEEGLYEREGDLPRLGEIKLVGTCSAEEAQGLLGGMRVASGQEHVGLEMYQSRQLGASYTRWTFTT